MRRRLRRKKPTRSELIERKHGLEGEIRALMAELGRLEARNASTAGVQRRLDRLRDQQYRTRHEIDRTDP